jgi:hypothetical protein
MNSLNFGMKHTCKIVKREQDQKINFVSGSVSFNEGYPVIGSTSLARGIIKTVNVEFGAWASGDAAGFLIISFVTGSFQNGETLSSTPAGNATVPGDLIPHTNELGTPIYSEITIPSKCLFSETGSNGSGIQYFDSGEYIVKEPLLFLPANTRIERGDHVIGEVPGYNSTYKVLKVATPYRFFTTIIDHKEAELQAVEKRNDSNV